MVVFRSLIFNIAFYALFAVLGVVSLPVLLLPRRCTLVLIKSWARINIAMMRVLAGIRFEVRGLEHIPQGACLVASKHQSMFETFALLPYFDDPAFILKRELYWLPLFGWYAWRVQMIPIDRGARSRAMRLMTIAAARALKTGRQIIIFPEGTRRSPGARPDYKYGLTHLYAKLKVPCVPVALNSGCFWPRRTFLRYPGKLVVEFLPAIPAGMDKSDFHKLVCNQIETASSTLCCDAINGFKGVVSS
jgi:1-acyl-sn-glycerol-3-phosphate acyltransferase